MTTLGTGTLNGSGVATFSTSALAVSSHSITAVYGGDTNFTTSTSSAVIADVDQDAHQQHGLVFRQSIRVRPIGDVHRDDHRQRARRRHAHRHGNFLTMAQPRWARAHWTVLASRRSAHPRSHVSSHSITAVYGGDTNFTTSTSSALTQTVDQDGTSSAVSSSVDPSVFGQSVTFTATVTADCTRLGHAHWHGNFLTMV